MFQRSAWQDVAAIAQQDPLHRRARSWRPHGFLPEHGAMHGIIPGQAPERKTGPVPSWYERNERLARILLRGFLIDAMCRSACRHRASSQGDAAVMRMPGEMSGCGCATGSRHGQALPVDRDVLVAADGQVVDPAGIPPARHSRHLLVRCKHARDYADGTMGICLGTNQLATATAHFF